MMKYLLIFAIALLSLDISGVIIPQDKKLHLVAGTEIGFAAAALTVEKPPLINLAWSVGSSATIGIVKELGYDKLMKRGTPEVKDALWTAIGGITGWAIVQGFKLATKGIEKAIIRKRSLPRIWKK